LLGLWKDIMNLLLEGNVQPALCYVKKEYCQTCFFWIEGAWSKVVVVVVLFCSPFEHIVKKLNFVV
jgi:hypothetical protein